jgi:hypothetical protein
MIVKGGALAVREPLACRPCATAVPEVPALPATGELPLPADGGAIDGDDDAPASADDGDAPADEGNAGEDGDTKTTLPDVDDEP